MKYHTLTGKTKRFIRKQGQWYREVKGQAVGRPLPPCALTLALDRQAKKEE